MNVGNFECDPNIRFVLHVFELKIRYLIVFEYSIRFGICAFSVELQSKIILYPTCSSFVAVGRKSRKNPKIAISLWLLTVVQFLVWASCSTWRHNKQSFVRLLGAGLS